MISMSYLDVTRESEHLNKCQVSIIMDFMCLYRCVNTPSPPLNIEDWYSNWVKCNLVWNHTLDSKSDERAAHVWFQITRISTISIQSCNKRSSITTLSHLFWIAKFSHSIPDFFPAIQVFNWSSVMSWFVKVAKFVSHFPTIWLISSNKPWNLFGCCVLVKLSHWLGKRCD